MNYNTTRQQLIEVASLRPEDIKGFYDRYTTRLNDCVFLVKDAPEHLSVLYRGRLKKFKASEVPALLAGVNLGGPHTCGVVGCINPDHMR